MLPVATISRLVELASKRNDRSQGFSTGQAHPHHGEAEYKRKGETVWAIEKTDGTYYLYHYGTCILEAEKGYTYSSYQSVETEEGTRLELVPTEVPGKYEVFTPAKGLSVSDQQGINALLQVLGIKASVSREGNTADYGGIPDRR